MFNKVSFPGASATSPGFFDKYSPQILSGLTGAGIGAATMGLASPSDGPPEEIEQRRATKRKNMLLGSVLGGVGGVGLGTATQYAKSEAPKESLLWRWLSSMKNSPSFLGSGAGLGAHALWRNKLNSGFSGGLRVGGKPVTSGGAWKGKTLDTMADELTSLLKTKDPTKVPAGIPPGPPATAPDNTVIKNEARTIINRMLANETGSGKLSQNPLARGLGVNFVDPAAESSVANVLRRFNTTPEGRNFLSQLLGPQQAKGFTGFDRSLPFLSKELLGDHKLAPNETLARSNFRSMLGRAGSSALLFNALNKLLLD